MRCSCFGRFFMLLWIWGVEFFYFFIAVVGRRCICTLEWCWCSLVKYWFIWVKFCHVLELNFGRICRYFGEQAFPLYVCICFSSVLSVYLHPCWFLYASFPLAYIQFFQLEPLFWHSMCMFSLFGSCFRSNPVSPEIRTRSLLWCSGFPLPSAFSCHWPFWFLRILNPFRDRMVVQIKMTNNNLQFEDLRTSILHI